MKNKKKNKEKTFGMNLRIDNKILQDADQMALTYREAKQKLLEYIDSEGYRVVSGPKLIPLDSESNNEFKVEAKALPRKKDKGE